MPYTKIRYDNFLSNYNFFSNSISFRILSSKALEKFKNVQAFQLNQLVNGKFHFEADRREILLLKYDLWSRFLYEIENICIELNNRPSNISNNRDIELITALCDKTFLLYKEIIFKKYTSNFDLKFSKIWFESHQFMYDYMINKIKNMGNLPFDVLFARLVDIVIETLQYTLVEIYEIDCIFKNKDSSEIFMVITDLSSKINTLDDCPFYHRLSVYKKYFNIESLYFKNYTDELIPEHIIKAVKRHGIAINFEKSIFNV